MNNNVADLEKQEIFNNLDRTGEELKVFLRLAQKKVDSQIQLAKFEAIYALTVSKEKREETMNRVNEVREELWEEALKKANGDKKKASVIYDETCNFP